MTGLTPEARYWYIAQYADSFYRRGQKADAEKLVVELEGFLIGVSSSKVTDLDTGEKIVNTLAQMGKTDAAQKVLAQLPAPALPAASQAQISTTNRLSSAQQWRKYGRIYQSLATAYVRDEQVDKAVALFWTLFERTKPQASNARRVAALAYASRSYSGYTPLQTSYPAPTTYYDRNPLAVSPTGFQSIVDP